VQNKKKKPLVDKRYKDVGGGNHNQIHPGRSAISMKSHFLKYIIPQIQKFGMMEEEVQKLEESAKKKCTKSKFSKTAARQSVRAPR
jgi:hypothetical protein